MENQVKTLEQRFKDHIKNYNLSSLYEMNEVRNYLKNLATALDIKILLTERHGERAVVIGDFDRFIPDVVHSPGRKIKVYERTIGHLYVVDVCERPDRKEHMDDLLDSIVEQFAYQAMMSFRAEETLIYAEELEESLEKERYQVKHAEKKDALTGTLTRNYFTNRMNVVERSFLVPVAVICFNINDWKYINTNYGEEESDRLIKIVASIIKKEAKPEYIIGRVEGDVFHVLIPMAEEGEAYEYCRKVQAQCLKFEDPILAPSVACGFIHKTNIEEKMSELFSDAEYEMLQNKIEMKSSQGYLERLEKRMSQITE